MSKTNEEILYGVVETHENNQRNVISTPEIWIEVVDIENGVLSWPIKGALTKRKKPTPPEDIGWQKIPCKILKRGLTSLRTALAEEKRLSLFSNTESEAEEERRKNIKRKHPITSGNLIDVNLTFNKIKATEVNQINKIIFDPVVPDVMLASVSEENDYQENDLNALLSIVGHDNTNANPDMATSNSIEGSLPISSTTDASLSMPSNSNGVGSTYTSLAPMAPIPNYCYYPYPHMYANMNYLGNANASCAQNNMIPAQYQSNGQIVPSSYTYTNVSADNRPNTYPFLQQPSSSAVKSLPPSTQYPLLTNISPNWSQINVSNSTMASTSIASTSIASTSMASINMASTSKASTSMATTSMATTSKINIIANKQIVGPRTEINGKTKQFQPTSAKDKMIRHTIGNKNCKHLKLAMKKNDKMINEHQTVKGKKQVKAFLGKEKVGPQNSMENSGGTSSTFGGQSIEYFKLIHKEILNMKTFNKNEAAKRRDTDKKITDALQKLSRIEAEILQLKDSNKMSVQDLILEQDQIQEFDSYFSITDQKELEEFVFKLSRDPVYKNLLKIRLARIGGAKPQLMLRAIMKYLIHDSVLAADYCWTGGGKDNKGSFKDLTILNNTILESIQMQHRLYTEDSYNKYMKNFVNQAKFRLGPEDKEVREEVDGEENEKNEEDEENENEESYENEDEYIEEKDGEMPEFEYEDDEP